MDADVNGLIQMFETSDYFRTYPGERNPSFSANCNVLICLWQLDDTVLYVSQIAKAIKFVTTQSFRGEVNEKWVSGISKFSYTSNPGDSRNCAKYRFRST
jgi:hypothetical protein